MKVLKVISKDELPALTDRDINCIYFLYDKLEIYVGQSQYTDPYVVSDTVPSNPIQGMIYFTLDTGNVYTYYNGSMNVIAEIESEEMLELLAMQGGSYFFVNADKRYLDVQKRIITLPYRNGVWNLTVDSANNIVLDQDTVIAYNMETGCFDIIGKREDYDLVFTKNYRGIDTDTAETTVEEHSIKVDVKISENPANIIKKVDDGIIAVVKGKVTTAEFNSWKTSFNDYKASMEAYLRDVERRIEEVEEEISEETINRKVHEALIAVYPDIEESMEKFEELSETIEHVAFDVMQYTDEQFDDAVETLKSYIDSNPWDPIPTDQNSDG
jgi:methyl-accepting chemotaxis protein